MENTISIKNSGYFTKTIHKGKKAFDGLLSIYIIKNGYQYNRIGISTGKKLGNSVKRNRIKRLIKEGYRSLESFLVFGFDIVFIPKLESTKDHIKMQNIRNSIKYLFKRNGLLKE